MNTLQYFIKIANKNKILIIAYIAILIAFTSLSMSSSEDAYSKRPLNIGIVKQEDSQFGNSLIEHLGRETPSITMIPKSWRNWIYTLASSTESWSFRSIRKESSWKRMIRHCRSARTSPTVKASFYKEP